MPRLERILETALYVDDLERATAFYRDVLQLELLDTSDRFRAFDVNRGRSILLLFRRGGSLTPVAIDGGVIPPHDGSGPVHLAFAVAASELDAWQARLEDHGVAIESVATWPRGGRSLYFRDPDAHVLELASPGVWATY